MGRQSHLKCARRTPIIYYLAGITWRFLSVLNCVWLIGHRFLWLPLFVYQTGHIILWVEQSRVLIIGVVVVIPYRSSWTTTPRWLEGRDVYVARGARMGYLFCFFCCWMMVSFSFSCGRVLSKIQVISRAWTWWSWFEHLWTTTCILHSWCACEC